MYRHIYLQVLNVFSCRFNRLHPKPDWARLPSEIKAEQRKRKATDSSDEEDGSDDEEQLDDETRIDLLKSTMGILNNRVDMKAIAPTTIDILRLKDANRASASQVSSIDTIYVLIYSHLS